MRTLELGGDILGMSILTRGGGARDGGLFWRGGGYGGRGVKVSGNDFLVHFFEVIQ